MELKPVKGLRPFTKFLMTIGELPSSYLVSMTYEEQLLWFCNYLQNTVIPTINNNGEAVEELQGLFIELKDYVDNYFENLDIQEEVNNKLDDMAESGELAELIAEFLDVGVLFVYDTASDLGSAENLSDGASAYILGKDSYNDGKGAFYKIREITLADVVDGDNIIAITNSDDLVGEKLPNYRMNQVESALDTLTTTTIPGIEEDITTITTTTIPGVQSTLEGEIAALTTQKWIMIGDSYGQGYNPDGNVTGWPLVLKGLLGLDNDHCTIACQGGAGFANTSYLYETILTNLPADDKVTDIIFGGGYNDLAWGAAAVATGFANCSALINTKFPNAKVHVAFFPCCSNDNHKYMYSGYTTYLKNSNLYNWNFLAHISYSLLNASFIASDNIHITQAAENTIANAIYMAINGGYHYSVMNDITLTKDSRFNAGSNTLRLYSIDDMSFISNYAGTITCVVATGQTKVDFSSSSDVVIGQLSQTGLIGKGYYGNQYMAITDVILHDTSQGWRTLHAAVTIDLNGQLILHVPDMTNDTHNGYLTLSSVDNIQIPQFCVNMPTITL